jgi:dipeptidyl aminopeptidase/acylaminoacyl peptidase
VDADPELPTWLKLLLHINLVLPYFLGTAAGILWSQDYVATATYSSKLTTSILCTWVILPLTLRLLFVSFVIPHKNDHKSPLVVKAIDIVLVYLGHPLFLFAAATFHFIEEHWLTNFSGRFISALLINGFGPYRVTRVIKSTTKLPHPYYGKLVYSKGGLHILDLSSGREIALETECASHSDPSWDSSGRKIVFGLNELYVMDVANFKIRLLATQFNASEVSWSPDTRQVCYHTGQKLFIYDVSTGQEKILSVLFKGKVLNWHWYGRATWSPDGRYIAIGQECLYLLDVSCIEQKICHLQKIPVDGYKVSQPAWSPDSQKIAFINGDKAIHVVNIDGSNQRQLTDNPFGDNSPTWSPDGQYIAFERTEDTGKRSKRGKPITMSNIYIMKVDGTELTQITTDEGYSPSWGK